MVDMHITGMTHALANTRGDKSGITLLPLEVLAERLSCTEGMKLHSIKLRVLPAPVCATVVSILRVTRHLIICNTRGASIVRQICASRQGRIALGS